jgi:hypothetical protein
MNVQVQETLSGCCSMKFNTIPVDRLSCPAILIKLSFVFKGSKKAGLREERHFLKMRRRLHPLG